MDLQLQLHTVCITFQLRAYTIVLFFNCQFGLVIQIVHQNLLLKTEQKLWALVGSIIWPPVRRKITEWMFCFSLKCVFHHTGIRDGLQINTPC